jgi:hypothetical protein
VFGATLAMGIAVYGVVWIGERSELGPLLVVGAGAAVGGLTYLVAGLLLQVQGLRWSLRAFVRR